MVILVVIFFFVVPLSAVLLLIRYIRLKRNTNHLRDQLKIESERLLVLESYKARLSKYEGIADADARAAELLQTAQAELDHAKDQAGLITDQAKQLVNEMTNQGKNLLDSATTQAGVIVDEARKRANEIAGSAYDALNNAALYERTAKAMRNIIEGYGDQYIIPGRSLLDDLAEEFGYTEAGEELKKARALSRLMIRNGSAATCEYVEPIRRTTAINFVIDAFNGKIDSILSRVKDDNYGSLKQEFEDAYSLVNYNGKAFREARITEEYLAARLAELKWATVAQQLKIEEREEQRRIKEQIREEEKARREYERAMRDAAKEEDLLRKAMEKAQQQIEQASMEQRAQYELQLQELAEKLRKAEERNQRAISMAQQTKRGHVYIISNVGSFGENVYKIGLTRRLEPLDRIRELGDSSVPFEFDVHALIFSEDAPALESQLQKHFLLMQMNKVNFRKEFFRVDLEHIREEIEKLDLAAKWTMVAEAREYRETLAIERAIRDNPAIREAWINRQLEREMVERSVMEALGSDDEKQ